MIPQSVHFVQWLAAALALLSALVVVLSKNAVVSAMGLLSALFLTGILYFGLGAPFIGAAQILIYAGAIAVLIAFIVMLLDLKPLRVAVPGRKVMGALALLAAATFFFGLKAALFANPVGVNPAIEGNTQSPQAISVLMLSKYMLPFQVTGLLVLAAVLGVVPLAKSHMKQRQWGKGGNKR